MGVGPPTPTFVLYARCGSQLGDPRDVRPLEPTLAKSDRSCGVIEDLTRSDDTSG
jgi:hypothetical protein